MRRSRSEAIQVAVGSYLKRRHYDENFVDYGVSCPTQSECEMAVLSTIASDIGPSNCVSYSSINSDATLVDQQFSKLKSWVADLPEPARTELMALLCPVFAHLYIEVVRCGMRQQAAKMLRRHQAMFMGQEDHRKLLDELAVLYSDVDSSSVVKAFRSSKLRVPVSSEALAALNQFLAESSHLLLLQVLQLWIDLQVDGGDSTDSLQMSEDQNEQESDSAVDDCDKEALNQLRKAIRALCSQAPPAPPLLLFTAHDTGQRMTSSCVSSQRDLVALGMSSSEIQLWNVASQKVPFQSLLNPCTSVRLACDIELGEELDEEDEVKSSSKSDDSTGRRYVELLGHTGTVYGMSFLEPSRLLLSCSRDGTMRSWNVETQSCVAIYRGHMGPVWRLATSPLGVYIATASADNTALLWMPDRVYPLRALLGHKSGVESIRFHPNSQYVATGSADGAVHLWDTTKGELVRMFPGHTGSVLALDFSPNGAFLASSGNDKQVRVWDLRTSEVLYKFCGHTESVTELAWSLDGLSLSSAGEDGSVRLWNVSENFKADSRDHHASGPWRQIAAYETGCRSVTSLQHISRSNTLVAVGAPL